MNTTQRNAHTQNVQKQLPRHSSSKTKYPKAIIAILAILVLCLIIFRASTSGSQTAVFYSVDDAEILYEDGQQSLCWDYHRTERYDERTVYQGTSLLDDMLHHFTYRAAPWLYMVSRDYLMHQRLLFYPGIIHEDELFTVLLFIQSHRISCLKTSLVHHRVRANSTMTRKYSIRNVSCYLTVMDELFAYTRTHLACLPLIRKYVSYTLNGVFETAYQLPFIDKCKVYYRCFCSGYLRYIRLLNQIKFWIKN